MEMSLWDRVIEDGGIPPRGGMQHPRQNHCFRASVAR
jgi:hypothetical protein